MSCKIKIVSASELENIEESQKQAFFNELDKLDVSGYDALKYTSWFSDLDRDKVQIIDQSDFEDNNLWD